MGGGLPGVEWPGGRCVWTGALGFRFRAAAWADVISENSASQTKEISPVEFFGGMGNADLSLESGK